MSTFKRRVSNGVKGYTNTQLKNELIKTYPAKHYTCRISRYCRMCESIDSSYSLGLLHDFQVAQMKNIMSDYVG